MSAGQKVLHVAGWESCGFFKRALSVLRSVSILFPTRLEICEHSFDDRTSFRSWLIDGGFRQKFDDPKAHAHSAAPFCWFSKSSTEEIDENDIESYLGGHDDTLAWCRQFLNPTNEVSSNIHPANMVPDGYQVDHGYDYDLVVVGGGSGGMAAAKEAAQLGAKVACLDFVTPSPAGTTWGLGGTCVNVGCIPKKLYHAGSLLNEALHMDAPSFGLISASDDANNGDNKPPTVVSWPTIRENIHNHIRSLNFKYRVALREKQVTYLNKLAKFQDAHTIEATDKKGRTSSITAARFLICVGGRPSPLDCPGGELAISSDDIFFRENSPGKTLCIGASYISLECAGFLAGLGHDTTVAVRSILLRGFDRECADKIGSYMEDHGVKFKRQVVPTKLEKVADEKIHVTFSDGTEDTFDTVLTAIGRYGATEKLGLENIGVSVNPKNKRILGKNEQTSCPNVYVVGDALDDTPELTPVAIQAGKLLAHRLFSNVNEAMDYINICTTVFTPIEYSCVGLSEDDAIEKIGEDNVEVYHKEFQPLEWTLAPARSTSNGFAKVVVDKTDNKVLGMHYLGPNAGEVMQGYGVSMRKGFSYKDLIDTVGIHPTTSEEIVTLSVTKSSGESASAGGC